MVTRVVDTRSGIGGRRLGAGEARPNNAIVGLTRGRVCIYSDAATEVLVDLLGSFGPSGLGYQPTPPIRVLDTRRSGTLGAQAAVGYSMGAAALGGRVPGAASVNVTAANHTVAGYVTTYDCITRRDTSTVNQRVGQGVADGAIVPLDGLRSCAWTSGGGDLIVDLNGWTRGTTRQSSTTSWITASVSVSVPTPSRKLATAATRWRRRVPADVTASHEPDQGDVTCRG